MNSEPTPTLFIPSADDRGGLCLAIDFADIAKTEVSIENTIDDFDIPMTAAPPPLWWQTGNQRRKVSVNMEVNRLVVRNTAPTLIEHLRSWWRMRKMYRQERRESGS